MRVAKNIWRIINTISSIWLGLIAHSFPRATLPENCSLFGTENVRGQISEHIFAPNEGYCLYIHLSKQGGQLRNEFFIFSEDVNPSPGYLKGWRTSVQKDCGRPWTKKLFKNSYSRNSKIGNTVVPLMASRPDQLTENYRPKAKMAAFILFFCSYLKYPH